MKKMILFMTFMGLLICYNSYAISPTDPPSKQGTIQSKTVTSPDDNCSLFAPPVTVTVRVTISDCPDYDCAVNPCVLKIAIIQNGNIVTTVTFNPTTCTYQIQATVDNSTSFSVAIIDDPTGTPCQYNWNKTPVVVNPPFGKIINVSLPFCP